MATTLSQFYSDKGQALPSVSQRGSLAAQAGIQGYTGTAAQNNQLLNFIQTSGTGQTGTQNLQSIQPPVIPAATALGNTKPVQLPTAPQGTSATELGGASAGYLAMPTINSLNQLGSATQTANQNAQTAQNDYMAQFTGLLNQMQNRPGELEKQYQIQQLSQDAMKAKANYDSVELAYRRKKENLMNDASLTSDQKAAVIGDIDRKEASQKADIAIDYNLKAGLLSNAKELMNKQLELELEPMKMKVDFYKDNRDRFDKILDKTEMRQYDYIQKKEERAYQAAKEAANRKFSLIEKAIDNGSYTPDMKNMSYSQLADKVGTTVGGSYLSQYAPGTSGYTQGLLLSSGKNKKALTEGQITKIEKAKSAVTQLQNVDALMKDAKTGIFGGRFSKFLTKFGGAPDAYAAQAALTGLIPTLARGTYGEVGVLTDQDVALYKQTVPNLTSSKSQNNLVQATTLKTVQAGLKNQLETLARGGYDVAQFAEDYDNFSKNILSIENNIIDKDGNSLTKIRVSDIVKQNPSVQPVIEQMLGDGKNYSDILIALGEY
jgi:hypothetical protein